MEDTLLDEHRTVSKSRMPAAESRRIDLHFQKEFEGGKEGKDGLFQASSGADGGVSVGSKRGREEAGEEYDNEVYDDRMFYAMLLKVLLIIYNCNHSRVYSP